MDFSFLEEQVAVIGNFPYNISSQILFQIIEHYRQIPEMVGMFQKEVAERKAAQPRTSQHVRYARVSFARYPMGMDGVDPRVPDHHESKPRRFMVAFA